MISGEFLIIVIFTAAAIDSFEVTTKVIECSPNRVYKKDDVTCICSSDGQWPHQNCSLVFTTKPKTICEPDSYVTVNCNICKCSKRGNIVEDLCTKHSCQGDSQNTLIKRRSSDGHHKCEPNHWYALSSCRFCYCINKNELLCSGDVSKEKKVFLGNYDLTDCGPSFLSDVIKLFSTENPFKLGAKNQKQVNAVRTQNVAEIGTNNEVEVSKQDVLSVYFNHKDNKEVEELAIDLNDSKSGGNVAENNSDPENAQEFTEKKPIAANTIIPFSNEKDSFDNDSNDLESLSVSKESEHEVGSESKESEDQDLRDSRVSPNSPVQPDVIQKNESNEIQDSNSVLRVNIPDILKKMFNFRKRSMVSLENANCVPGTSFAVHCNTCFCLKNGKMLCTKKKCT